MERRRPACSEREARKRNGHASANGEEDEGSESKEQSWAINISPLRG